MADQLVWPLTEFSHDPIAAYDDTSEGAVKFVNTEEEGDVIIVRGEKGEVFASDYTNKEANMEEDKLRHISATQVQGTPWFVVWTGDLRSFFYNSNTKLSVWEKPAEMVMRSDVMKMLESPYSAEELKKKQQMKQLLVLEDEPMTMKSKLSEQQSVVQINRNEEVGTGKEAALEEEVKAARERVVEPLERRMRQFRDLLEEKQMPAFSTWEKELHMFGNDLRYLLLTSKERKQEFDKYVREIAEEQSKEKDAQAKERRDAFRELCFEVGKEVRTCWSGFSRENEKVDRLKAIDKSRDRLVQEYNTEVSKKGKNEKEEKRKIIKKDFNALFKETEGIDSHIYMGDSKKMIGDEERYLAKESSEQREDYVGDLKDEHRREKDKERAEKERSSRISSKSRRGKRSKSRSRSNGKEKKQMDRTNQSFDATTVGDFICPQVDGIADDVTIENEQNMTSID